MLRYLINTLPRPLLIRLSYVFRQIAPLLYKGNAVDCPVCKKSFSKFLGYGSDRAYRENVLCPYCLSLERHRLLWLFLNQRTNFFSNELDVLHIAPEQCFYERFKGQKNINYFTGDLESPLADYHFDLHDIPFERNKFDIIICNHVMEHVRDDHRCMQELLRVLKPGGWAIMQVPIDYSRDTTFEDPSITSSEDRELHYWQKDHVRLYGTDYPKKLENAGFKVTPIPFAENIPADQAEKFRLQKEEIIYFLEKEKGTPK